VTRGVSAGFTGWGLTTTTDPGWGLTTRERVGFGIGVSGDAFSITPIHGSAVVLAPGSASDFHTIRCVGKAQSSEYEFSIDGVSYGTFDIKDGSSNSSFDNVFRFVSGSTTGSGRETLWNFVGLGVGELKMLAPPELAASPTPGDAVIDVPRNVTLSWTPGESADTHDVYFGEHLDDVKNATATVDPAGVYQGRQGVSSYAISERLDLGKTYYWRVDEVNAAPDLTVFRGNVWSFTVEPAGYPIPDEVTTVTASSFNKDDEKPENVISGSGLDEDDLHSADSATMWLSDLMDPNIAWIQFEFDSSCKLYQMLVWNYNSTVEPSVGFGIKEAIVEYSVDGTNWSVLGTTYEFAQGPGEAGYANDTTIDFLGVTARYIRITVNSNWSPWGLKQYGLSEVRFLYTPVWARKPSPDSATTDVGVDAPLRFRAGREAATHDVYLSTDEQAVIDGSAPVITLAEPSYDSSLELAATYSEVTANIANLQVGQDWTKHRIKALTLRFFGDPVNVAQQVYVKLNGTKIAYDGSAEDIRLPGWQMWYIDLASTGVDLSNVTELSVGFERIGAVGGQGMVFLDGIRLYSYDRQLITPVDPGAAGLQAHYEFEGNTNYSSGNARHGTSHPMFVPGKTGQAIAFNGIDQYVTITGYKGILADASGVQQPFTVAAWVRTIDDGDRTIASWGTNSNQLRVDFRLFQGRLRVEHGSGNIQGDTTLNDDEWHHVAVTVSQGATISYPEVQLWPDGRDNTRNSTDPDAFSTAADVDMAIGYRATAVARYFFGAIDEFRLYDRVLSHEEIAWLAGRIESFDMPF